MTKFQTYSRLSRWFLTVTATTILFAATGNALARGGGHGSDHGGMKSNDGMKNSEHKGNHKGAGEMKDPTKTGGMPTSGSVKPPRNTIHPIVTKRPISRVEN